MSTQSTGDSVTSSSTRHPQRQRWTSSADEPPPLPPSPVVPPGRGAADPTGSRGSTAGATGGRAAACDRAGTRTRTLQRSTGAGRAATRATRRAGRAFRDSRYRASVKSGREPKRVRRLPMLPHCDRADTRIAARVRRRLFRIAGAMRRSRLHHRARQSHRRRKRPRIAAGEHACKAFQRTNGHGAALQRRQRRQRPRPAFPVTRPSPGGTAPATETARPAPAAPTAGKLQVRSNPSGASVTLNGTWRGRTPLTLDDLAFGDYVVRVVSPGTTSHAKMSPCRPRPRPATSAVRLQRPRAAAAKPAPPPRTPRPRARKRRRHAQQRRRHRPRLQAERRRR